ncbi:hypothetical protein NECAME_07086 [Necator americanus]|uniref:Uncharacterized protein n=1 Tax=Necator americanus TaxID=51031 RepID=W2TQV4_NECAM|nr:hypothetical protein NECAME_07086 [Necator americanus]ETN84059.1 hypothetical protein NECAME_07086 [Necator americanus]
MGFDVRHRSGNYNHLNAGDVRPDVSAFSELPIQGQHQHIHECDSLGLAAEYTVAILFKILIARIFRMGTVRWVNALDVL